MKKKTVHESGAVKGLTTKITVINTDGIQAVINTDGIQAFIDIIEKSLQPQHDYREFILGKKNFNQLRRLITLYQVLCQDTTWAHPPKNLLDINNVNPDSTAEELEKIHSNPNNYLFLTDKNNEALFTGLDDNLRQPLLLQQDLSSTSKYLISPYYALFLFLGGVFYFALPNACLRLPLMFYIYFPRNSHTTPTQPLQIKLASIATLIGLELPLVLSHITQALWETSIWIITQAILLAPLIATIVYPKILIYSLAVTAALLVTFNSNEQKSVALINSIVYQLAWTYLLKKKWYSAYVGGFFITSLLAITLMPSDLPIKNTQPASLPLEPTFIFEPFSFLIITICINTYAQACCCYINFLIYQVLLKNLPLLTQISEKSDVKKIVFHPPTRGVAETVAKDLKPDYTPQGITHKDWIVTFSVNQNKHVSLSVEGWAENLEPQEYYSQKDYFLYRFDLQTAAENPERVRVIQTYISPKYQSHTAKHSTHSSGFITHSIHQVTGHTPYGKPVTINGAKPTEIFRLNTEKQADNVINDQREKIHKFQIGFQFWRKPREQCKQLLDALKKDAAHTTLPGVAYSMIGTADKTKIKPGQTKEINCAQWAKEKLATIGITAPPPKISFFANISDHAYLPEDLPFSTAKPTA